MNDNYYEKVIKPKIKNMTNEEVSSKICELSNEIYSLEKEKKNLEQEKEKYKNEDGTYWNEPIICKNGLLVFKYEKPETVGFSNEIFKIEKKICKLNEELEIFETYEKILENKVCKCGNIYRNRKYNGLTICDDCLEKIKTPFFSIERIYDDGCFHPNIPDNYFKYNGIKDLEEYILENEHLEKSEDEDIEIYAVNDKKESRFIGEIYNVDYKNIDLLIYTGDE